MLKWSTQFGGARLLDRADPLACQQVRRCRIAVIARDINDGPGDLIDAVGAAKLVEFIPPG
jgi:hypothetical protein